MHANVSCSFFGQVVDTVELSVLGAESPSDCGAQTEVDLHGKNFVILTQWKHEHIMHARYTPCILHKKRQIK